MNGPTYFIGLDLGQQQDYTALTVVEEKPCAEKPCAENSSEEKPKSDYHLRHLQRFDLGTPYQAVAKRTREVQRLLAEKHPSAQSYVLADATGVGRPVVEMLEAEGVQHLHSITITGGDSASRDGSSGHRVPKRDLVSTLQVLLQTRRLKFAKGLPDARVLRAELQNFKAKISLATGHDTYEAWREGEHDDLVLSLAMACWFAEHAHVEFVWQV